MALGLLLGFRLGSIPAEKLPLGELGRRLRSWPSHPGDREPAREIPVVEVKAEPPPDPCAPDDSAFRCAVFLGADDARVARFTVLGVHPILGSSVKVTIRGLDAPSLAAQRKCERLRAELTRNFLRETLAQSKKVDLLRLSRDPQGQILADVMADGAPVAKLLVEKGLARDANSRVPAVDWCD